MAGLFKKYFRSLYERTMRESYELAYQEIGNAISKESKLLDCGAGSGWYFKVLSERFGVQIDQYYGIEWDRDSANKARQKGLNVVEADLNAGIPHESGTFDCVIGLSVLEHLLMGCRWMRECKRVLKPGGKLVIVTPNISTYFTAALLLAGRMPSTGPHPDTNILVNSAGLTSIGAHMENKDPDVESDTPVHRHLVVFSYRELRRFLVGIGFGKVVGSGFGVYPFPNFSQPLFERFDKMHAHQLVFVATK